MKRGAFWRPATPRCSVARAVGECRGGVSRRDDGGEQGRRLTLEAELAGRVERDGHARVRWMLLQSKRAQSEVSARARAVGDPSCPRLLA